MTAALLDAVLAGGARTVVVIGTAKNVGKTVTFNALRAAALRRGSIAAVTSIGRDGEPGDALDGAPKPRIRLERGTLVALPRDLVPTSPALEILELGADSALGPMVFARARSAVLCEIGGPPSARAVRATIDRLRTLAAGPTFVDGALDRIAPLAGGDDAIVLATGGAAGTNVAAIAAGARALVARLTIPARDRQRAGEPPVEVGGTLDTRHALALLADRERGTTVIVDDPTRIVVRGTLLERLLTTFDLRCERPLRLVACTTSSAGAARPLDPRALVGAVAAATGLPTFDVLAELTG